MIETIILNLRTKDGLIYQKFYNQFGMKVDKVFYNSINKLIDLGLLRKDNYKIQLTAKGLFLANYVFREFID